MVPNLMWPVIEASWVVLRDDTTIPRWRTATILNFKKLLLVSIE